VAREAAQLIPYAVIAALSPLGLAATLVVMRGGRLKALAFVVGIVLGQLFACTALVAAGAVALPGKSNTHTTFQGVLAIVVGAVLLALAVAVHRRPPQAQRSSRGRRRAALDRLDRVHTTTASGVGLMLGIGGPKRLVLTSLAAASITAAGVTGSPQRALTVGYVLLATALVWAPVLAYLVFGKTATCSSMPPSSGLRATAVPPSSTRW
jgi:hypothetical protein